MIRSHFGPRRPPTGVSDEEAPLQIHARAPFQIQLFYDLSPHSRSGFPEPVMFRRREEHQGKVEVAQNVFDFLLEL